jgi:outer membrane protein OmpA-like peptidoglycan-associated protein
MNYRYTATLQEVGGDGYLDFSPAVAPGGEDARPALMSPFAESAPPQGLVLGTDRDHLISYPDLDCLPTSIAATDAFDLRPAEPGPDERVPHPGSDANFRYLPGSCTTALEGGATQTHEDHDDWSVISLPFRENGDSADGPIDPSDDEDFPTDDEIDVLRAQATTSDLRVSVAGPAAPVQVGSPARVTVWAANAGNVHSGTPVITVEVPPGVVVSTIPPACSGNPLVCASAPLAPGATTTFDLEVVPAAPGPVVVRASLADPRLADSNPADNTAEATVTVVSTSTPTPTPTPTTGPAPTATPTPTSTSPALPPTPAPSTSAPPQVPPQLAPSSVVVKSKSYFRYNSTKLTKAQKRKLRALVREIPDGAAASTVAVGMVRATGATKADRVRAKARARAVARYLRSAGLTGPILVKSTGRTQSKTANARRVNITITYMR